MAYYTGSLAAVPSANRQKYVEHCAEAWTVMRKHGVRRMLESWGVDIPKGKVNDLRGAVNARDDEDIVFAWLEWEDKAQADAAWSAMPNDPDVQKMSPMPFDGSRMIDGGFSPLFR